MFVVQVTRVAQIILSAYRFSPDHDLIGLEMFVSYFVKMCERTLIRASSAWVTYAKVACTQLRLISNFLI